MNGTTIYFDFETGGVEPHHPNTQLAAIAVRDGVEVGAFDRHITFDPSTADPEALQIIGYTPEKWVDAVPERTVAVEFRNFLAAHADMTLISKRGAPYRTARLAGHNVVAFDVPRLRKMMDQHLAGAFFPGCWWYPLDTYQRSIWYFFERGLTAPRDFQLQTLAAHFKISVATAHDALSDVRTCARLAAVLMASET